jgi:hypothetical protein
MLHIKDWNQETIGTESTKVTRAITKIELVAGG